MRYITILLLPILSSASYFFICEGTIKIKYFELNEPPKNSLSKLFDVIEDDYNATVYAYKDSFSCTKETKGLLKNVHIKIIDKQFELKKGKYFKVKYLYKESKIGNPYQLFTLLKEVTDLK